MKKRLQEKYGNRTLLFYIHYWSACIKRLYHKSNFQPEKSFSDPSKQKIKMSDWYVLKSEDGQLSFPNDNSRDLPLIPAKGHLYFDISQALKKFPQVKRLGLVFFMGIGDYFYATNFIKILHQTFPSLPLDAYVSDQFDANNSPLVAQCLKYNPDISHVFFYHGIPASRELWKNYNWSDCQNKVSDDTLLLPLIYEHNKFVLSRLHTLCETFSLPAPIINHKPLIHSIEPTKAIQEIFTQYKDVMNKVVFIQGSNRSSNFCYPFHDELVQKLLDSGFFVITVEGTKLKSPKLLPIDIKKLKMTESISLIQQIHKARIPLYMITTCSCFNSIASGLNIPTLGMQCFYDECMSSVIFSNIYLITPKCYKQVLTDRQFIAPGSAVIYQNDKYIYKPEFVFKCFEQMVGQ